MCIAKQASIKRQYGMIGVDKPWLTYSKYLKMSVEVPLSGLETESTGVDNTQK